MYSKSVEIQLWISNIEKHTRSLYSTYIGVVSIIDKFRTIYNKDFKEDIKLLTKSANIKLK